MVDGKSAPTSEKPFEHIEPGIPQKSPSSAPLGERVPRAFDAFICPAIPDPPKGEYRKKHSILYGYGRSLELLCIHSCGKGDSRNANDSPHQIDNDKRRFIWLDTVIFLSVLIYSANFASKNGVPEKLPIRYPSGRKSDPGLNPPGQGDRCPAFASGGIWGIRGFSSRLAEPYHLEHQKSLLWKSFNKPY